jgi:proline dehydrogenase
MNNEIDISFNDTAIAFSSKSNKELKKAKFLFTTMSRPWMVSAGTFFTNLALNLRLPVKGAIKNTIYEQFCGGETIEESQPTIDELAAFNIGTILDYSVEGATTTKGFEITTSEIIKTIHKAKGNPHIPFCVFKVTGFATFDILEKVQRKEQLSEKDEQEWAAVQERVDKICKEAFENDVRIFIDAEESWIQNTIDGLAYAMMEKYNHKKAIVYNTYQMYRHDMLANLKKAFQYAAAGNYWLGVKLVRGAYMEKERERALEMGYPSPIQPNKQASDDDYNAALKFCIDNKQRVALCSGSHNEYSNYYLALLMHKHSMPNNDERVYFAQLYGMSDNISFNLANKGYNVAKYVPYGPVEAVMPYLFRRAAENTSIAGQTGREFSLIKAELTRRKNSKN